MHINLQGSKAELRNEMKTKRVRLETERIQHDSTAIAKRLNDLLPVQKASTIMGYAPMMNEVNLESFFMEQLKFGKTILLPRVEGNQIRPVEWKGWQETKISSFGIREPLGECFPVVDIDVVLVPGLAFDGNGFRLGYGGGFYDRFLSGLRNNAFKCGICYEFQVVESIFPHKNDIPMHWIVTEKSELVINWDFF